MLRSYLLSIWLKSTSLVDWAERLRSDEALAILSGFSPDHTPSFGAFYDFFHRLWPGCNNFLPHLRYLKKKPPKGKRNGEKSPSFNKDHTATIIKYFEKHSAGSILKTKLSIIGEIYSKVFLTGSMHKKLLNFRQLVLAGDGTPVKVSNRERSHSTCYCHEKGIVNCHHKRWFSQPDANWGWDSSRNLFYYGYNLYLFTDANSGLPVFPILERASRHDLPAMLHGLACIKAFFAHWNISALILDSAHDATAVYEMCNKSSIMPFIDLNPRGTKPAEEKGYTISDDGVPICPLGLPMKPDGTDKKRHRAKYICPQTKYAERLCLCDKRCTKSTYGRVVNMSLRDNPRLFCDPPRGSPQWKQVYNKRTSAERANKYIKIDGLLEEGHHHSSMMWYIRLFAIISVIHVNAWRKRA
ncbi:transposase [Selenomonas sp. AB3002]|uniref:transposase n=1 Tax=Selenomonas sp. AB3002 TaxID=1392502 RepID=UPI00068D4E3B